MSKVRINDKWSMKVDNNFVGLYFEEPQQRMVKNKETGVEEQKEYIAKDLWFYPNIQMALEAFTLKSLEGVEDVKDILEAMNRSIQEVKSLSV